MQPQAPSSAASTVIVVGGSAGIGRALAEEFARAGSDIVLVARGAERLHRAAAAIERSGRASVGCHTLDATAEGAAERIAALLAAARPGRRYLIVAIGAWEAGPLASLPAAAVEHATLANALAPLAICQAAVTRLAPGDGVLVVGSLAGALPLPWMSLYSASKAFAHMTVLGMRQEMAGTAIHVCVLAPGPVLTSFVPRRPGSRWRWLVDLVASSPETVARAGRLGLLSDTAFIVPGLLWRAGWLGLRLLPAGMLARLARLALAPLATGRPMPPVGEGAAKKTGG